MAAGVITDIAAGIGLIDIWRHKFPMVEGYTYYFAVHNLHKCIDYWLVARSLVPRARIHNPWPRTYSDHALVLLTLEVRGQRVAPFTWRFPPYSLLNTAFKQDLAQAIEECFCTSRGSVTKFCTMWEAYKVYICAVTITKHAGVLKSLQGRLARLEKEIGQLKGEYLTTGDARPLGLIYTKLMEFQEIAHTEVKHMGKYAMARAYG
ncbi:hypothetical protein NDU88_000648 [Pleurodeles waltl]|uniref:Uncharacterized protein n=1 Tax=Pleurodeles waltl TaxID=8319 RepID=A0AAV7V853_PLEWA|nr:hypothetical protein NDU88_000648 [Pleurodeles waltl]